MPAVGDTLKEGGGGGAGPSASDPTPPAATVPEQIHSDILAAEFLVGLFWSATNSFRHDSILRPFPAMFLEGGGGGAGEGGGGGEGSEGAGESEGTEPQGGREGDKNKDIEGLVRTCDTIHSRF